MVGEAPEPGDMTVAEDGHAEDDAGMKNQLGALGTLINGGNAAHPRGSRDPEKQKTSRERKRWQNWQGEGKGTGPGQSFRYVPAASNQKYS